MAQVPNLTPPAGPEKPKAKTAAPPPAQKWYRVLSPDKKVPRAGGDFVLRQGKEISSANYNITQLKNLGVQLEEIKPPGWWLAKQGLTAEPEPEPAA